MIVRGAWATPHMFAINGIHSTKPIMIFPERTCLFYNEWQINVSNRLGADSGETGETTPLRGIAWTVRSIIAA